MDGKIVSDIVIILGRADSSLDACFVAWASRSLFFSPINAGSLCFVKLGLIAYVTLMLLPIFNHNAGIHQWNIQGKNLILWTKASKGSSMLIGQSR